MASHPAHQPPNRAARIRAKAGLALGPLAAAAVWMADLGDLSAAAQNLAAVVVLAVVLWVCESLPLAVTAMVSVSLCVLLGVAPVKEALVGFSDPIIFLFIGSFILAEAMCVHGLDRRIALGILSRPSVATSSTRILLAFGGVCGFLSMWLSNTATTAMMVPVAIGVLAEIAALQERRTGVPVDRAAFRTATGLMLMIAYGASTGGLATPIGTPPNLIGIGFLERTLGMRIGFVDWMLFAVPLMLVLLLALAGALRLMHPPEIARLEGLGDFLAARRAELGAMGTGEKSTLAAFGVAVALWVAPGIIALGAGSDHPLNKDWPRFLPEGMVPIFACALLFMLPGGKQHHALTWEQAAKIDWGTVLLFASGISLGTMMFNTGLAEAIGRATVAFTGISSAAGILFVSIALAIVVSEAASNTASANMIVPVSIAMAQSAGVDPVLPALGATLGASFGFMMPISTAPNAIVHGTGMVPIGKMIRTGAVFDVCGLLVLWAGLMAMAALGMLPGR